MTFDRKHLVTARRAFGNGLAGLIISALFTIAGLPWTLGNSFGPPDWLQQRLAAAAEARAHCAAPTTADRAPAAHGADATRQHAGGQPQTWWL